MVAGIHIAIVFHHARMAALLGISTDARQHTHPVGKRAVEDFHKHLTHIVAHPVIKDGAEEVAPLCRGNGSIRKRNLPVVGKTRQGAAVFMFRQSLHDRGKLQVLATVVPEEMIELQRMLSVIGVDHRHSIPFHPMFLQQTDALHHLFPGRLSGRSYAIVVVILLRSVDGNAYQPMVLCKELAPLVGEESAVGLDDIVYLFAVGILLLKRQRLPVEVDGTHQRLASVPGKEHLGHGLCLDVLPGELLQHLISHQMSGSVLVKMVLFQIITVFASQVAMGACGLQHHIQGLGKWSCYIVVHHFFMFYIWRKLTP